MSVPVYICPAVEYVVEKQIVRVLNEPGLWNKQLCPPNRLFLIYGQPGTQMLKSLNKLIDATVWKVTRNTEDVKKELLSLQKTEYKEGSILIIDKVHLLFLQPYLFSATCMMKSWNFSFIIGISEDPLDSKEEQHPFWAQFKVKVCNSLPNTSFYKELLQFYFNGWKNHWEYSTTVLTDEDYTFLANCCAFCTPRHVKYFCWNVFSHIRNAYPDEKIDLNIRLLKDVNNLLLFKPFSASAEDYCIINEDASEKQRLYDPTLRTLAISFKRARIEVSESEGNIIGGAE